MNPTKTFAKDPDASASMLYCKENLHYDIEAGRFVWTKDNKFAKHIKAGTVAGTVNSRGYVVIKILGKYVMAHRLAWLVTYGRWPEKNLDHINRKRADNRIGNLREATCRENCQNISSNTSGFPGVHLLRRNLRNPWQARIYIDGKTKNIGYFPTAEAGAIARAAALRALGVAA